MISGGCDTMNNASPNVLLLVDLQNDFCPNGALSVEGGDEVVPLANELQSYFSLVVATKDWHPLDHVSFASNHPGKKPGDVILVAGEAQTLWPTHCVQETKGALFHENLQTGKIKKIFYKGTDRFIDSYSAFFDNAHYKQTGLNTYLKAQNIKNVYIMGLATDYCVKFSCLDAQYLQFNVYLIEDACRGVELNVGDIAASLTEMEQKGVHIIDMATVRRLKPL